MTSDTIVLAHPYEGAFYWFISQGRAHPSGYSYYRTLYGSSPSTLGTRAAAITSLYPKIILGAADAHLPDSQAYLTGHIYEHPDLNISLDFNENEWADDNQEIAKHAATDPALVKLLIENESVVGDSSLWHHFLCRTVLQIRLAAKSGGTLIGDDFFKKIYSLVAPWVSELSKLNIVRASEPISKLDISTSLVDLIGLDFSPANLDAFAAIRASKEISRYATSFRQALADSQASGDLEGTLIELMAQAMETSAVANKVSSAFQTTGSIMNVLGFIPLVNTVTSVIGVTSDVASRAASSKADRADWILLGPKLREIALLDALKRRRSR